MIVYGGELDAINGVLRQTYNLITFTGNNKEYLEE